MAELSDTVERLPRSATWARDALVEIGRLEREADELQGVLDDLTERYAADIDRVHKKRDELRQALEMYLQVERDGEKLRLPEGTIFLSKKPRQLVVADLNAVKTKYGLDAMFHTQSFSLPKFKEWAVQEFERTGEVPPGCDVVPERRTLVIRSGS